MDRNTLQEKDPHLLPLIVVEEITGFKRSYIYKGIANGTFPAPIKVGRRASRWNSNEVYTYVRALIKQRDATA
jgi:prophage regulatory protein